MYSVLLKVDGKLLYKDHFFNIMKMKTCCLENFILLHNFKLIIILLLICITYIVIYILCIYGNV